MGFNFPDSSSREEAEKQIQGIVDKVGADLKSGKINPDEAVAQVGVIINDHLDAKGVPKEKAAYSSQIRSVRELAEKSFGVFAKDFEISPEKNPSFWARLADLKHAKKRLDDFHNTGKQNFAEEKKLLGLLNGAKNSMVDVLVDAGFAAIKEMRAALADKPEAERTELIKAQLNLFIEQSLSEIKYEKTSRDL